MNRRSLLKAVVVAPVVGLGTAKAMTEVQSSVSGYLVFRDIHQKIVVDRGFDTWVESIQVVLKEVLGVNITTLRDVRQLDVMRFFINDADIYWSLFAVDKREYNVCSPKMRRAKIETRITLALNELQLHFDCCASIAKRLNSNK